MKKTVRDPRIVEDFSTGNHDLCRDAILGFCGSPLFADNEHRYEEAYFGRRLRPHVVKHLDFSKPALSTELPNYPAFAANRVLFAMNEVDFLMMPSSNIDPEAFSERYSDEKIAQAYIGMPYLEKYLFSFLEDEIVLSNNWSMRTVEEYFSSYIIEARKLETLPSAQAILNAKHPGSVGPGFPDRIQSHGALCQRKLWRAVVVTVQDHH
jgi:hypothetical protein